MKRSLEDRTKARDAAKQFDRAIDFSGKFFATTSRSLFIPGIDFESVRFSTREQDYFEHTGFRCSAILRFTSSQDTAVSGCAR